MPTDRFSPVVGILGFALVFPLGCASRQSVDEEVEALIGESAAKIGAKAAGPRRTPDPASLRKPEQESRNPATLNLLPQDLRFTPAAEARDVAARLRAYNDQAIGTDAEPSRVLELNLSTSLRTAQQSGREYLNAEEENILAAIRLLQERHLWGPRLFNDTSATVSGTSASGQSQAALNVVNQLKATQRLPYGGDVEAAWLTSATEQLRDYTTNRYQQASSIALSGNLPLLRGAGMIAQEGLISAERGLIYQTRSFERFRRQFLVQICSEYFELLNTAQSIRNQATQLEQVKVNAARTDARVKAGRIQSFETGIAENEVLSAEASLAGLRDQYTLQLERFKIRLGLPVDAVIKITEDQLDIPEPEIAMDDAAALALEYRLDLQNQRDQLDDSRRSVANARNGLLPDLNLSGSVNVPTDPTRRRGGVSFSPSDLNYSAGVTLSLPLDRENERLAVKSAVIALEQAERSYAQARDNIVVSARAALRAVELSRYQLTLAEKQVETNEQRKRAQKLQEDTVGTQAVVDSENALLAAANQRDRARTNLRIAVLNFLLTTDQLRVASDGTFQKLPGM